MHNKDSPKMVYFLVIFGHCILYVYRVHKLRLHAWVLHNLNDRHMSQNKMENVPGKYKFESQENFDEFLKAQGKTPFSYNTTFEFLNTIFQELVC